MEESWGFEYPRQQQRDQASQPEVMKLKTSQTLLKQNRPERKSNQPSLNAPSPSNRGASPRKRSSKDPWKEEFEKNRKSIPASDPTHAGNDSTPTKSKEDTQKRKSSIRRKSPMISSNPPTASSKTGGSSRASRGTRKTTKTISTEPVPEVPDIPKKFLFLNEVPTAFSQHPAFVGFVPLDQLPRALVDGEDATGRYLLRCVEQCGKYILIITVYGDHCEIHYRIGKYRGKKSGLTMYAIEGHPRSFKTIGLLLRFYTNESQYATNRLRCGYSLTLPMDRLSYHFPSRMIKTVEMIGEGNFCQVQKIEQTGPGDEIRVAAMKACHVSNDSKGPVGFEEKKAARVEILHEARILSGFFDYTFITMFYGICFDEPIPKLIMEYCPFGSIESYITNKDITISVSERILMIHDIASGMAHLEACFCVHRDLASRNCLISAKGIIKVADFGLSRQARELESEKMRFSEFKAPVRWMAPECLNRHPIFSNKSDVWSYGMTVFEIFSEGCRPYEEETDMKKVARKIRSYEPPPLPKAIQDGNTVPADILALMKNCWCKNTMGRPPFAFIAERLIITAKSFPTINPAERCFKPNRHQCKLIEPRDHCELKQDIQALPDLWFVMEKKQQQQLPESDGDASKQPASESMKGKRRIPKVVICTTDQKSVHPELPEMNSSAVPSSGSKSKSKDSRRSWRNSNKEKQQESTNNLLNDNDSFSESQQKKQQRRLNARSRSRRLPSKNKIVKKNMQGEEDESKN